MKSMLYVGAALMIGASIYGFVDYKQTENRNEFKKMYATEPVEKPVIEPVVNNKTVPVPAVANEVKTTKTASVKKEVAKKQVVKKNKKRKLNHRLFSRAPLREEEVVVEPVKDEVKKTENKEQ